MRTISVLVCRCSVAVIYQTSSFYQFDSITESHGAFGEIFTDGSSSWAIRTQRLRRYFTLSPDETFSAGYTTGNHWQLAAIVALEALERTSHFEYRPVGMWLTEVLTRWTSWKKLAGNYADENR
ncbi:hypothetical protein F4W66_25165 (plasmid) [Escherichia coli]|nr:hypothetical protein F4W66_25165 [Escherichia coli]